MNGIELIAAERQRQVEGEGWTPEHDDEHSDAAMIDAAICYADQAGALVMQIEAVWPVPLNWPWDCEQWKPSHDPIRNLVKAGALIAAEIDRIQRAGGNQ